MREAIQPLTPVRDLRKGGRPRRYDDRVVLNAIFYVLRSGCQWRMLPHDLMPFDAAHRWFSTWRRNGTWDKVHDELRRQVRIRAGREAEPTAAILDSQSIKSSEGGQQVGFDPAEKTTGRKRHLVCDTLGLVLVVMVTSASVQDRPGGRAVLAALYRTIALVWADGGYANSIDEGLLSWAKAKLGLVVEIVRRTEGIKGFRVLPRRWVAERTFAWLVRNRRLARDYERLTANSEVMIKVAMIRLMAARLASENIRWSNATERETARRLTVERLIAA